MVGEDYRITDAKTIVLKYTARTFPGSGAALTDRGAVERSFICLQM